jgi:hypothetical protein
MSDMLINDLDRADALVDMSNVLRNTRLGGRGPADLVRLERVGEALAALYGATETAMFGVADANLLTQSGFFLDPRQRRTLRSWDDSGMILTAGKADLPLLQIAEETGLPIITSDRFGGHRREFPWLNDSDDAILEPQADRYGNISLQHVTLRRKDEWEESRSAEHDVLVQQGLSRHFELLGRYWGCPEPRCPRHDPASGSFVLLPLARGDRLVCEQHGLDMVDLGPRPRVAQLKIMRAGREQGRFTVTQHQPVIVGRSAQGVDLSPFLDKIAMDHVSRTHLRFDLDSSRLTVTDVSRNGSMLILQDGTRLDFHRATRPFTVGDRAQVHPGLDIIRSGRRYPSELPASRWAPARSPNAPPTPTVSL